GSSTRWARPAPTDAGSTCRPSSDRCTREAQHPDSCVARLLPLTADKVVSLPGATISLEHQLHLSTLEDESAASHRAGRRRLPLPQSLRGCARRCHTSGPARNLQSEFLRESKVDSTTEIGTALSPEPPGD